MGNCWGSCPLHEQGHNSSTNQDASRNYRNAVELPATTSSSNCRSQFSEAMGEIVEERNPDGQILEIPNLKVYTFANLKNATKNFKPYNLLGEGGFGKVYKGWVDDRTLQPSKVGSGMVVAIKKLNPESMQGFEEWQVFFF